MLCRICSNANENEVVILKERMYGTNESFTYFLCSACGCLQIQDIPQDLGKYYSDDYYSFERPGAVTRRIQRLKGRAAMGCGSWLGHLLLKMRGSPGYLAWMESANTPTSGRVLDVGAGRGSLVFSMREAGIDAVGVDPFVESDICDSSGSVMVRKATLDAIDEQYDLVMFHHSFEHVADQHGTLEHAAQLLTEEGTLLVRIPLIDCYAWGLYGDRWVQLDAPRHLYLHSRRSFELLAEEAHLKVDQVIYDSTAFQFWGSERYLQDLSLAEMRRGVGHYLDRTESKDRQRWTAQASLLNELGLGDQAAFFLSRDTGSSDLSVG